MKLYSLKINKEHMSLPELGVPVMKFHLKMMSSLSLVEYKTIKMIYLTLVKLCTKHLSNKVRPISQ